MHVKPPLEEAGAVVMGLSWSSPRGKFDTYFFSDRFVLVSKTARSGEVVLDIASHGSLSRHFFNLPYSVSFPCLQVVAVLLFLSMIAYSTAFQPQCNPYDSAKLVVRHAQLRRLLVLETGDSNQTSNIMIALNTDKPLLHGKHKLTCLLIQVRAADKTLVSVRNGGAGLEGVGVGGHK